MVQLSDLVVYCLKRFLELDLEYRALPAEAVRFYAECYGIIDNRILRKSIVRVLLIEKERGSQS
jgi:hypothetical protein